MRKIYYIVLMLTVCFLLLSPNAKSQTNKYTDRFLQLRGRMVDKSTGYFSKDGAPYHSVETFMCEAPDHGHETTSEAYSYWVWLEAMYGRIKGDWTPLNNAWNTLEKQIIPSHAQQPSNDNYVLKGGKATYAAENPQPYMYPSKLESGVPVGTEPVSKELYNSYNTSDIYGMHWLLDCDNFYGFGNNGDGVSTPSYINTFERGTQESVFEAIPHPSIDLLKWGGPNGFLDLFVKESGASAKQWRYTNAPDADARAVQAMYWAAEAVKSQGLSTSVIPVDRATKMGDYLRLSFFDKYYKKIGNQDKFSAGGTGYESAHYLMSWYYAWGGPMDASQGWAWRIGDSHNHFGYQNPMAAYALSSSTTMVPKSANAQKDWAASLKRQVEMYRWLQSSEGAIAGGCTNSWNGVYDKYPAGKSTFYGMAFDPNPVYTDPNSNGWFGFQAWSVERLAEYYYASNDQMAKDILVKWVKWITTNAIKLNADGTFDLAASLDWVGEPDTWNAASPGANSNLHVVIKQYGRDLGIAGCLAKALTYYAAATQKYGTLDTNAKYYAQQLLDRMWNNYWEGPTGLGVAAVEERGDFVRMDSTVYVPAGWSGKMPNGDVIKPGVTFLDIRSKYKTDPQYQVYLDAKKNNKPYTAKFHRFWAQTDIALANAQYGIFFGGDSIQTNYTVNASAGLNGTITPAGAVVVTGNTDQTFSFTPAAGYAVDKVLVDNVDQGAISSYTFKAVAANHTLSVSFKVASTTCGILPSAITQSIALSSYNTFKTNKFETCSNGIRVKFDNTAQTVSEGIGYAMLLAAYAKDQASFDGLYTYYKANLDANGLMNWQINGCAAAIGFNGATDADEDVAMALIIADKFIGASSKYTYSNEAKSLISKIKQFETEPTFELKSGDAWIEKATNISYHAPAYYKVFGSYTNDSQFWNSVADKCYEIINNNLTKNNAVGGLVSDWCSYTGTQIGTHSMNYGYDACRTPFRIALDYLWFCDARAKAYLDKTNDFILNKIGGIKNVKDGYAQNGTATGQWHNMPFVGTFACAGIASTQAVVDGYAQDILTISSPGYYEGAIDAMVKFFLSGMYVKPDNSTTSFTITATSGIGGAISPSSVSVAQNGSQTFTITPSAGFTIAGVTVDGVAVGAVSTYTFSNVTANHTIAATFSANATFTISATAGAGGLISPSSAVVAQNGSQVFTITPSTGFQIAGVTVDGASVGNVGTYTFSNVTANHTISATFSVIPTPTGGFTVSGTSLIDATNTPFIIKGINMPFRWYYNFCKDNTQSVRNLTNTNAMRVVWDTNGTTEDLRLAMQACIDAKIIPIVELHDVTGSANAADLVRMAQWYADRASLFNDPRYAKYTIINIANEWGNYNMAATTWRDAYKSAIKVIRDSGIKTTLMCDGSDMGKDADVIINAGKDVLDYDATLMNGKGNIMFSIHFYCTYLDGNIIAQKLQAIKDKGLVVIAGEFGFKHSWVDGSGTHTCDVPELDIMRICQEKGLGFIPWSWKGNSGGVEYLDMSTDWAGTTLTDWGKTAVDDVNGIKKNALTCNVFNDGPIANAGADRVIIDSNGDGVENVTLDGSASTDLSATITGYSWTENGTVIASTAVSSVPLSLGVHTITLTITDSKAKTSKAVVNITVKKLQGVNLALNKTATASSQEPNSTNDASKAVDGSKTTRWSSAYADNQSITVDLQAVYSIENVVLYWEAGSAAQYSIQVSPDNVNWTTFISKTGMPAGPRTDDLTATAVQGRYVRMSGVTRNTTWGFSLYEFEVYGSPVSVGPKAIVGPNQILTDADGNGSEMVTLDGSASTDDKGTISTYDWTGTDGSTASGKTVSVKANVGTTTYTLKVTDNLGLTSSASMSVIVNPSAPVNIALKKPVTVSSTEAGANIASNLNDGNATTRWSSLYADPQSVEIDLGNVYDISEVILKWEAASAKDYTVKVSSDRSSWTLLSTKTGMAAGVRTDDLTGLSGFGRYIKLDGTARTSAWGYSLYEFEVYGKLHAVVHPVSVSLSPSSVSLGLNQKQQLIPTILPTDATNKAVTYSSDKTNIASVDANGLVTGIAVGQATITVSTVDGGISSTSVVTVTDNTVKVTGVSLSPATVSLTSSSKTTQLVATVLPTNATNQSVSYSVDKPSIASVSSTGLVTAVSSGIAIVTVTTADGGFIATSTINVSVDCSLLSRFAVPAASAIPTIDNVTYKYVYVLGTGGPSVSNITTAVVQWNLQYNGLYQFAFNTTNGVPAWYVNLISATTQTFASASPACKITGSGIAGLDGDYWANMDGSNFVIVSKTGNYAIYFSNVATAPTACQAKSAKISKTAQVEGEFKVFPTVVSRNSVVNIQLPAEVESALISIFDMSGKLMKLQAITSNAAQVEIDGSFSTGVYIVNVLANDQLHHSKIIVE